VAGDFERDIRRFLARVRLARWLGGLCEGLAGTALALAAVLLALRALGVVVAPAAWWALLLVPAVVWACVRVGRLGFDARAGAAHLDRRLGLDGLLLTALERDPGAHADRLREKLREADAALPHVRPRPLLLRLGLAAGVVAALVLWPAPKEVARAQTGLVTETLDTFSAKLDSLRQDGGLRESTRETLEHRLEELRRKAGGSEPLAWKDLDALGARIEQEQSLQTARLARARQDLGAFARGDDESAEAGASAAAQRLGKLLADAQHAGLLDRLPEDLRERLQGALGPDGEAGALQETFDDAGMKQLAAALSEAAADKLQGLSKSGLAEGLDDLTLSEALQGVDLEKVYGKPCRLCKGKEDNQDCPG
jgi:hypothetical protein